MSRNRECHHANAGTFEPSKPTELEHNNCLSQASRSHEPHAEEINKWDSLMMLEIGENQDDLSGLGSFSGSKLGSLRLSNCKFGASGIERIARHLKLQSLSLSNCRVLEGGLEPISRMENLYSLYLNDSSITDEQFRSIKAMPKLHIVDISGTQVTNQTLEYIRANMPEVFSVDARHVAFDSGIMEIVNSVEPGRQFDVTVSKTSVTSEEVEKFGLTNGRISVVE